MIKIYAAYANTVFPCRKSTKMRFFFITGLSKIIEPKNKKLQNSVSFLVHSFYFLVRWFYSTLRWKKRIFVLFCAGTQCLRRWHKFLSFFVRYYENSDILPQHGWYKQKFRCWNRQKLIFFKNPIFKVNYKIAQNSIGFFKKINFCRI